jgi:hypothetical protein
MGAASCSAGRQRGGTHAHGGPREERDSERLAEHEPEEDTEQDRAREGGFRSMSGWPMRFVAGGRLMIFLKIAA